MKKPQLIVVSNRLPVIIKQHPSGNRVERSPGGLATALNGAWRHHPGGVWIGWAGTSADQPVDELLKKASRRHGYSLQAVTLSADEVTKFYSGFANEIIWPLFHDMPSRCNFDPDYWEVYQQVNHKFAAAASSIAHHDDFIWVHDYHLMLVAQYLREGGKQERAGFFLHIPFPSPDIFEKLPWSRSVLRGLLNFNVVGFQTDHDQSNFLDCLTHAFPEAQIERSKSQGTVYFEKQRTMTGTFAISIDFEEFAQAAAGEEVASRTATIRANLNDNVLILGVDRLDYTKGIPERLKAFRIVLRKFPELRRQITLVQVVVPSREEIQRYKELLLEIERLVSEINGEFTQEGWVPIHYMHRNLTRQELLAHYRAADIALVTPLRDGMNLVAKEFCAAQVDERGVLIMSEFAGAAPELSEGAIIVNPNDYAGVAQAIHDGWVMSKDEKQRRIRRLRQIVKEHDVHRWASTFLEAAGFSGKKETAELDQRQRADLQVKDLPIKTNLGAIPGVAIVASPMMRRHEKLGEPRASHR